MQKQENKLNNQETHIKVFLLLCVFLVDNVIFLCYYICIQTHICCIYKLNATSIFYLTLPFGHIALLLLN